MKQERIGLIKKYRQEVPGPENLATGTQVHIRLDDKRNIVIAFHDMPYDYQIDAHKVLRTRQPNPKNPKVIYHIRIKEL